MNKFTLIIHNKGWTVKDACKHWGIRYETYNRHCNDDKFMNKLECMCKGLEDKGTILKGSLRDYLRETFNGEGMGEGLGETFIKGVKK